MQTTVQTTVQTSVRANASLAEQLAKSIELWMAEGVLTEGMPLVERSLAQRLKVSRSPVREALKLLAQTGAVKSRAAGGYVVAQRPAAASAVVWSLPDVDDTESIYYQIAADRLSGALPEKVTENDLMRRYALSKSELVATLQRIGQEGWIERLPGHGWQFLPILTSPETYDQAYRFRILNEAAALTEPGFKVDEAALRRCLAEQQALIDGAVEWVTPAQLFDANTRLHETIAGFSGNVFIVESLKRINRLRRLMEYKKVVDREAVARRCREHKVLIELLLSNQLEAATDFLRLHLRDAAREKSSTT